MKARKHKNQKRPFVVQRVEYNSGDYLPRKGCSRVFVMARTPGEAARFVGPQNNTAGDNLCFRLRVWALEHGTDLENLYMAQTDYYIHLKRIVRGLRVMS